MQIKTNLHGKMILSLPDTKREISIILLLFLVAGGNAFTQDLSSELTIDVTGDGSSHKNAVWFRIETEHDSNFAGWYGSNGPAGFPAFTPLTIKVPAGKLTVTARNSNSDETSREILITPGINAKCILVLHPRFNMHKLGYFSFDSHNHMDGDSEKNKPPFIYPYCSALGIDHIDVCQLWNFDLGMNVSYDSIIKYLEVNSTDELTLGFGAECPKLRYGHTWTVNHPGLKNPLGDYLKWHDVEYFESLTNQSGHHIDSLDLRGKLYPKWHPPFIDRLLNNAKGGFSVAAHPTRWWHNRPDEIYPTTNAATDLAFDLLVAGSYKGIVVMGDCSDNIFYQDLWFRMLNLGYRLTPVAESDGNVAHGSLGNPGLTYVRTGDSVFNMKSLTSHLLSGQTMLSGKAVMLLKVDGIFLPGSVLVADGKKHSIGVTVYSEPGKDEYVSWLVLYRNGKVVEKLDFRKQKKRKITHRFIVQDDEAAWYIVKSYGKNYPRKEIQFDVEAYALQCLSCPDNDYTKNTGVSFTAPVYFNSRGWTSPPPLISSIHGCILDNKGKPLRNLPVEIWNIDKKISDLITDDNGCFELTAPATIDVRFTSHDGIKIQKWLFYEYPPLLDLIEDTYTISWAKTYPGLKAGQMPWEAFHYDEMTEVLKDVRWTIMQ
jgi:hypothetical protein